MTWVWVILAAGAVGAAGYFFLSKRKNPLDELKGKIILEFIRLNGFGEYYLADGNQPLIDPPGNVQASEDKKSNGKYIMDEKALITLMWPPLSKNQIAIRCISFDEGISIPRMRPGVDENTPLTDYLKFASNMEYMNWAAKFGKNFSAMANALMHPKWPIWAYLVIIVNIIVSGVAAYYGYKIWGVIGG